MLPLYFHLLICHMLPYRRYRHTQTRRTIATIQLMSVISIRQKQVKESNVFNSRLQTYIFLSVFIFSRLLHPCYFCCERERK